MTTIVKSVLFVDFDSLHLALHARDPALARRFAARPGLLIEAIEGGALIGAGGPDTHRRVLMRRLYADPRLIGRSRDPFVTQGFQIVDCPTLPGRERNSAEVQITLDTLDALGHATAFDEFILLGAETDFTPLIFRLRAHNRRATIYAPDASAAAYRSIADGLIEETAFVALLEQLDEPAETVEEEEPPRASQPREDLAQLARRIHAATNVPLFPPRVYAELFRALADDVAAHGYHFLSTAENVAARLAANGRRATRRQIAFVVKGLALKGHVFSEDDTPEQLAEVFREQVLFLARQSGIAIDARVERQVGAWIAGAWGGTGTTEKAPDAEPAITEPTIAEPNAVAAIVIEAAEAAEPEASAPIETAAVAAPEETPAPAAEPSPIEIPQTVTVEAEPAAIIEPAPASADAEPPVVDAEPLTLDEEALAGPLEADVVEAVEPPVTEATVAEVVPTAAAEAEPSPVPTEDAAESPEPTETPELKVEDLAAIADQPDPAAETVIPAVESVGEADTAATTRIAPRIRPPGPRNGAAKPSDDLDPFELSLLAAITQSIRPAGEASEAPEVPPVEPVKPDDKPAPSAFDDDIDDEIQRILAAYTQNRKPGA